MLEILLFISLPWEQWWWRHIRKFKKNSIFISALWVNDVEWKFLLLSSRGIQLDTIKINSHTWLLWLCNKGSICMQSWESVFPELKWFFHSKLLEMIPQNPQVKIKKICRQRNTKKRMKWTRNSQSHVAWISS